ncbi:MAG: methyltransferase domain-containing protein [Rhodospirillaceae bacterium]
MWIDVVDLRDFYAAPLGRLARRVLRRCVRDIWPDVTGQRVLGIGFATPVLSQFDEEAERVVAVMPPSQGVMHWPVQGPGRVTLADDDALPFPDRMFDRIVLVHALEGSAHFRDLLRECWRVLADGGKLLVIVPNRRGLWARIERSPFAHGRPYSMTQISRTLRDALFAPVVKTTALFFPPVWWPLFTSWTLGVERIGRRLFPTIAGVNIVEATKQIYAAPTEAAGARRLRDYILVPSGASPAGATSRSKVSRSQRVLNQSITRDGGFT